MQAGLTMVVTNWGGVVFGVLFVAMAFGLFFSRRFAEWSFKFDLLERFHD
jgi:hypothetical protein